MTCASLQDKQVYSGESGIFQWELGANSIGVGANLLFGNFFQNCMKMKEIGLRGGCLSLAGWIQFKVVATLPPKCKGF